MNIALKLQLTILLIILTFPIIVLAQVEDYDVIMDKMQDSRLKWDSTVHFTAYFNGVHPILVDLFYQESTVIGSLDYSNSMPGVALEGYSVGERLELEAIDSNNEFVGVWKYKTGGKELEWINANGTRSYTAQIKSGEIPDHSAFVSYNSVKKSFLSKAVLAWGIWENRDLNNLFVFLNRGELSKVYTLEPDTDQAKLYRSLKLRNRAEVISIQRLKSNQLMMNAARKRYKFKQEDKIECFDQNELSENQLLEIRVPSLDEEIFNRTMKDVIHKYMYGEACDNGIEDSRFFWWNHKFVRTKMSYFDKDICSYQLHLINTCLGVDTLLYYNYNRKNSTFISNSDLSKKILPLLKEHPKYLKVSQENKKKIFFVLRKDGFELHQEFDLIKGNQAVFIGWSEVGDLELKKLLKSLNERSL